MNYFLHIFIISCIYIPPILGFNLVFGRGKLLHFGQTALGLAGAYGIWASFMLFHFPFLLSLLIGAACALCMALVLTWLSLRLDNDGLGVMSIALHLAILAVVLNSDRFTRGALGIPGIPRPLLLQSLPAYALLCAMIAVCWIIFMLIIERGKLRRNLQALAENHWHAEAIGVNRRWVYTIAFLISALGALTANVIFVPYMALLSPSDYGFPAMILNVMMVVAGGPGRVWGVVCAIFLLMGLHEGLRFLSLPAEMLGPTRLLLFGTILFIAVYFRRETLFPPERKV
ncbi:MAG: branched-chain amino acid ABC transporter permease [Candidatus Peribacteraceae bacterium]|nr:branched-chain amino acid ABC transporter permease [Candidatus Peribacteraceae bacterium]